MAGVHIEWPELFRVFKYGTYHFPVVQEPTEIQFSPRLLFQDLKNMYSPISCFYDEKSIFLDSETSIKCYLTFVGLSKVLRMRTIVR